MSKYDDTEGSSNWRPAASLEHLHLRARLLSRTRAFFQERRVLEVDTPLLSRFGLSNPAIESFQVTRDSPSAKADGLYLQTSPEYAMKRLLAAGSGDIYQVCHAFREGEAGPRHNPEFTLLEWYRTGWNYRQLMDEVESLISALLTDKLTLQASQRYTYRELFVQLAGLDPFTADTQALRQRCVQSGIQLSGGVADNESRDFWLDLMLTHVIEPRLPHDRLVFVCDYPASQAALAAIRNDEFPVAERFEVYLCGVELGNGYQELCDADEQQARFEVDNRLRASQRLREYPADINLLAALRHGLPKCAGVAIGFDRLVMIAAAENQLSSVLTFPFDRA